MHISKVQDANVQTERTEEYKTPTEETAWSRIKKALGPFAVVGVVIAKFLAKVKFILPVLLKSGGTMLVMILVYMQLWGWQFGVGFVLLLLVHETGHLIVAKKFRTQGRRACLYSVYGRVHCSQGSATQCVDGKEACVRYRWAVARKLGCFGLQRVGRILRRSVFSSRWRGSDIF